MSEMRTVRSLGVERPGQLFFFSYEESPPEQGQFRVSTLFTGFSAGTELTFVKGSNPYLSARWTTDTAFLSRARRALGIRFPFWDTWR